MPSPFDQSTYQVRFEWGAEGLARLAPADVVVVVDVLRFSSTVADLVAAGGTVELEAAIPWSINGAAVAAAADAGTVLLGSLRNAAATARAVMAEQERRGARTSVAVIAAGERAPDDTLRFAVEDQLGAGAVIAALSDLGIDHSSPEAAAASESFRALRRALRHLLSAGGSGRELAEGVPSTERMADAGIHPVTVAQAAELDAVDAVPVLRDGVFVAFA
ncbi:MULTISPECIES: 2-phosphosulfolactate phosphatase [Microbacterium]|uniref:2-phosphosulfolactate phosphatase n=1 Tax=Microbacterium TaxID=33882 RepID=UPI00217DB98A|nr:MULTISPECIES: 2-phosphosulfolactate phosphatase [Microbacterium]UWF77848.1 2-phosphosulfolactate phosphatase [Microbacterium neungamense]WCM56024.1 2-phosphosulfolactate phosphatase [Microbacterium sp. EF45047]